MSLPEDERANYRAQHQQQRRRLPAWVFGLIITGLALFGLFLAYTKHIPFTGHGYEIKATFANATGNLSPGSPVRIAGVNVGKVLGVERDGNNATVTFNVDDSGQPVKSDATVKIRPRIFFEGNYFLDLDPGSPSAPEMAAGETIPITHTATAVQFDEILRSLDQPVRKNLGRLLAGYGTALTHVPTRPSENRGFEPEIQGKSAAAALNLAFDYGERAGRSSAVVLRALTGTEPDDLSRMIRGTALTMRGLGADERALAELVGNWNTFTGALAAESANLRRTLVELPPTLETTRASLANLNRTLPVLRTWARVFEPAVAELPDFIDAGQPWLRQALPLLSESEAGGLVRRLKRSMPGLNVAASTGLKTLSQISQLSRCTTAVLVPTGQQVIDDRFSTGQPNYREFFYATVQLAGESQNLDGNGIGLALTPSIGDVSVETDNAHPNQFAIKDDTKLWGNMTLPPLGTQPQFGSKPPYRPEVKCFSNEVPDLNLGLGEVGPPSPAPASPPGP